MYVLWKTLGTEDVTALVPTLSWWCLIFEGGGRTYAVCLPALMQSA